MKRQVRDMWTGIRLTERTRKLTPETRCKRTENSDQLYVTRMMLVLERGYIAREMKSECCEVACLYLEDE